MIVPHGAQTQQPCTLPPMRRAVLIAALILASCSGDGQTTETVTPAPTLTSAPSGGESVPHDGEGDSATVDDTSATPPASDPSAAATTTLPPNAAPEFGLSQVVFGESAFLVITNWGNAPGTLDGLWLSQGTSYQALPGVELAPAEQVLIGVAAAPPPDLTGLAAIIDLGPAIGEVTAMSGEVGLHAGTSFDDPDALLAYVAWGDGPHQRAELATSAGLWDGTAVAVIDDAPSISTGIYPATASIDWSADVGG